MAPKAKARRAAVTVSGFAVTGLGLALLVLPGPGFVVVAAGLAILATEYDWAKGLLHGARTRAEDASRASVGSRLRLSGTVLFGIGMVAVGLVMALGNLDIPFVTVFSGLLVAVSGLILLGLTAYTYRVVAGEDGIIDDPAHPDREAPAEG